jgi:hypothetical protein
MTTPAPARTAAENTAWTAAPQCQFYVRTPVTEEPPTYRYDAVYLRGGAHGRSGSLVTPHPPAVGDLIYLTDDTGPHTAQHRVIERAWTHPQYGSAVWRHGTQWPKEGPLLTIIVVPESGPFRDEAPGDEAEDDLS